MKKVALMHSLIVMKGCSGQVKKLASNPATVKSNNFEWKINKTANCETDNVVYLIQCQKCKINYIGETERPLKERIAEHKGYIRTNKVNQPIGEHFSKPGHALHDLKVTVLENVKNRDTQYRKERESYLIRKFNAFYKGMNKSQ